MLHKDDKGSQRAIDPVVVSSMLQQANARLWASVWLGGAILLWSSFCIK